MIVAVHDDTPRPLDWDGVGAPVAPEALARRLDQCP